MSMISSKTGLLNLPDELLLEILSNYPSLPTPTSAKWCTDIDQRVTRRDALCALSQTCRKLWKFFRPFIWKNLEVCMGMQILSGTSRLPMSHPTRKERQAPFYRELYRQLDVVTVHDPSLAEHVRYVPHNIPDVERGD